MWGDFRMGMLLGFFLGLVVGVGLYGAAVLIIAIVQFVIYWS